MIGVKHIHRLSVAAKGFALIYRKVFSIGEIEGSVTLKWALGALLLGIFTSFFYWSASDAISVSTAARGDAACWPYFQDCSWLYFLEALPYYSQTTLYAAFFGVMLIVVDAMRRGRWAVAHAGILVLLLWKIFVMFVLSMPLAANYDYYDVVLGIVLLLLPHKEYFAKLAFVMLYFLASTIKIHEGWIAGTYFTSLVGGLPWISDSLTPLATNIVIFEQMIGSWFLLSRYPARQRFTLAFFVFFHLYSILLVGYRYPASALTMLLALFGPAYTYTKVPRNLAAAAGFVFIGLMFTLQFVPKMIHGDQRLTLEGNQYGLSMFEANHQCISRVKFTFADGSSREGEYESMISRDRCAPYSVFIRIKQFCERRPDIVSAHWTFDHSINGHPFYRIVDEEDACRLTYSAFSHNHWIRTPEDGAVPVGVPLKTPYR